MDTAMTQVDYCAVLTGDIIRSRRLSPRQLESVRSSLESAVDVVRNWKRGVVRGRMEFFRGDAWQFMLTDPALALRAAILLRATLISGGLADTRIAIGLGNAGKVSPRRISLSTGQAFVISGRALDRMTLYSHLTIEVPESRGGLPHWLPVVGHLCDALVRQWTRRQAELVCLAIDPAEPDYESIARMLHPAISKQAAAKSLNGAGWRAIREAVHLFAKTSWNDVTEPQKGCKPKMVV